MADSWKTEENLVTIAIDNGSYTINESLAIMLDNLKHTMGIIANEIVQDSIVGRPKNADKISMFDRLSKRHRRLVDAIKMNRAINRSDFRVDGIVGYVKSR